MKLNLLIAPRRDWLGEGRWVCAGRSLALDGTMWCHSRRGHMVRSSTRDSCTKKPECRSTQEEEDGRGNRRAAPINQKGAGWRGWVSRIQDRRGNRQLQLRTGKKKMNKKKEKKRSREDCPLRALKKMSTQVRGGRDVGRGMGLQTGRAEAESVAMTRVRKPP